MCLCLHQPPTHHLFDPQYYDNASSGRSGAQPGNRRLEELLRACQGGLEGLKQAVGGIKSGSSRYGSKDSGRSEDACLRAAMARKAWQLLAPGIQVDAQQFSGFLVISACGCPGSVEQECWMVLLLSRPAGNFDCFLQPLVCVPERSWSF